ncbi:DoxX family protein [Streptomyces sennicomposti]
MDRWTRRTGPAESSPAPQRGALKTFRSRDRLRPMMAWVDHMPLPALRALGAVETLGATGLVLPPLTGIAVSSAPAAAIGFVLLQAAAIAVHLRGGDRRIALNAVLVVAAAVTIWPAVRL